MRAVRLKADLSYAVDIVERPEPAADELLVAPRACGICGTDLHILKGEFPGAVYPVIPGHELAGIVVASGREARGMAEGTLVAVDPNVVCGSCRWCRAGRPNLCVELSVIGVSRAGAAAELVTVPARNAFAVSHRTGAELAAMIEPLACVLNALERAGEVSGRSLLIMGAGTMGLLLAITAMRAGAAAVSVADPAVAKHAIARMVGVERVLHPRDLDDERFDLVFEAAGALSAADRVMGLLQPTGTWVQVGVHAPDATVAIKPFEIFDRELRIVGSNSLADRFPAAVELMPDIDEQVARLVTSRVSVWEFGAALASMSGAASVKTQLTYA